MRKEAMALLHEGTVIPAIPLALDPDRQFSAPWQKLLTRYYLEAGAGGIAIGVHTTQFEIRNPEHNLLRPVLQAVVEEIAAYEAESGRAVVRVTGVCGPEEQAVEEARQARDLGYDAVLLSPGGLGGLSEADMLLRTRAVAADMPVIGFFLQPAVGGRLFSYGYWQALCEIPGVVAIKCAPFNRYQTLDLVRAAALSPRCEEITLYTGNDDNILLDLLSTYRFDEGGKTYKKRFQGGLLGHWSVWTHQVAQQFAGWKAAAEAEQVPAELLTLAQQITDANGVIFDAAHGYRGCIPGIHEVLRRQGLMQGIWCLSPEETLSPGQGEELDRIGRMYPHLTDNDFVRAHLSEWKRKVGIRA